jgi:hypothetical protein
MVFIVPTKAATRIGNGGGEFRLCRRQCPWLVQPQGHLLLWFSMVRDLHLDDRGADIGLGGVAVLEDLQDEALMTG